LRFKAAVLSEPFTLEEGAENILLEVPAIDSTTHVVGDFPNLALQGVALLDACHDLFLEKD
jgi:hypothetical protein